MNNEFLRPRENICKWFNTFGDVERSVYIAKGEKTQFSHKINRLNRFTKCLNWFRQQNQTREVWRMIQFKTKLSRFKWTQDEDWYDSNFLWIDSRQVREFCETIQTEKRRFIHESIQVDMNRFTWTQRLYWIDSDCIESIQTYPKWFLTLFQKDRKEQDQTTIFQGALTCSYKTIIKTIN